MTAMTAMPADADALAGLPLRDARTDGIHEPDHFMAGNAWILQARPVALLDQGIAVADTTGLDFDSHQAGARLGDFAFNKFKRPGWPGNLGGTHLWHNWLLVLENSAGESGIVPDDVNGQTKIICNGSVTAGKRPARGQSSLFSPHPSPSLRMAGHSLEKVHY